MLKPQLDPHHWYVVRIIKSSTGVARAQGVSGLHTALHMATLFINEHDATKVAIFDGQPSDGAKLVAIIDLEGINPDGA